jgi:FKBP-type peptidyl-prolyl cis-trans isomerase
MIKKSYLLMLSMAAFFVISLVSCDPSKKYEKEERDAINSYLASNPNLNFSQKPSGLYFLETQPGTGALAEEGDTVYVIYTGKLLNGYTFDTNVGDDLLKFPVNKGWMIKGFDEALTYMNEGSKAKVLVPSSLGYGSTGYYTIGGYTPLLFDLTLTRIVRHSK